MHAWLTNCTSFQAATGVVVYGDMNATLRGIGWGWAGFTWLYNVMFLFALVLICKYWRRVHLFIFLPSLFE